MIGFNLKNKLISLSSLILLFSSCAYFNTFYNAKLFFNEAENLRLFNEGEDPTTGTRAHYQKVIDKCNIVIVKYDKSKFIDDAYFLKGKAHFFRAEYQDAEDSFNRLINLNPGKYQLLSEYWLALIKWKNEKHQPAINDLNTLFSKTDDKELSAKICKSQAEIYLELKKDAQALSALEKAAELTDDRADKGKIYFQLAELADKINDNKQAINNYEKVIKYSLSNDRIMDSHLRIVQRYRNSKRYKKASEEILSMLKKPNFEKIYADLNLELAKLNFAQNKQESAINKLNDIVVKYPNTKVSSEAFYMLGNEYLFKLRDFEKADYYFQQSLKDYKDSENKQSIQMRLKEISQYKRSKDYLSSVDKSSSEIGSSEIIESDTNKIVLELYNLGELEAFHFGQLDTSLIYFSDIIEKYQSSDYYAKAMYTISVINRELNNLDITEKYERIIIEEYPDSEYAEYLRSHKSDLDYGMSNLKKLHKAEELYLINPRMALDEYKNIANQKSTEASVRALLFLANEYNNKLFIADSAAKYYQLIIDRFPNTDQAKIADNKLSIISNSTN